MSDAIVGCGCQVWLGATAECGRWVWLCLVVGVVCGSCLWVLLLGVTFGCNCLVLQLGVAVEWLLGVVVSFLRLDC